MVSIELDDRPDVAQIDDPVSYLTEKLNHVSGISEEELRERIEAMGAEGQEELLRQLVQSEQGMRNEPAQATRHRRFGSHLLQDVGRQHQRTMDRYTELYGDTSRVRPVDLADEFSHLRPGGMTADDFRTRLTDRPQPEIADFLGENYANWLHHHERSPDNHLSDGRRIEDIPVETRIERFVSLMPDFGSYNKLVSEYRAASKKVRYELEDIVGYEESPLNMAADERREKVEKIIEYCANKWFEREGISSPESGDTVTQRRQYLAELGLTESYEEIVDIILTDESDLEFDNNSNSILHKMFTTLVDMDSPFGDVKKLYGDLARSKEPEATVLRESVGEIVGKTLPEKLKPPQVMQRYMWYIEDKMPEMARTID